MQETPWDWWPIDQKNTSTSSCIQQISTNFSPDKLIRSATPLTTSFSIWWTSSLCTDCRSFKSWRNSSRSLATGILTQELRKTNFANHKSGIQGLFLTPKQRQDFLNLLSYSCGWNSWSCSLRKVRNFGMSLVFLEPKRSPSRRARVRVVKKHPLVRWLAEPNMDWIGHGSRSGVTLELS